VRLPSSARIVCSVYSVRSFVRVAVAFHFLSLSVCLLIRFTSLPFVCLFVFCSSYFRRTFCLSVFASLLVRSSVRLVGCLFVCFHRGLFVCLILQVRRRLGGEPPKRNQKVDGRGHDPVSTQSMQRTEHTHTNTHTHLHTRTHTFTHTHTPTPTHTHTHTRARAHTHRGARAHTRKHAYAYSHTDGRPDIRARARTGTRARSRSHARACTHAGTSPTRRR
jgi:hypothetical protein